MIYVGTVLYGFCGGCFGRDSYENKRVEALGVDWVVARGMKSGKVVFSDDSPENLEDYTIEREDVK